MIPKFHFAPARGTILAVAVASCFASNSAFSNPTGPTVVNGTATIVPNGSTLTITNSPNAIINWQGFSIGASEATRFIQQSPASAVLNRVTTANNPSNIFGLLQSNGRVFLVNPSGILFGSSAQVDVAGLVASTLNLSNEDFLGGRLRFTETPGAGAVVNFGNIATQEGGQVYLIGRGITQSGNITGRRNEVILAAGERVELVDPASPNLRVEIVGDGNTAFNFGRITAEAGRIGIYAGLIEQRGQLHVDDFPTHQNGEILMRAARDIVTGSSSLLATRAVGAGTGARVDIEAGGDINYNGGASARDFAMRAGGDINFDTETPLTGANISSTVISIQAAGNIAMNATPGGPGMRVDGGEVSLTGKTITQAPEAYMRAFQLLRLAAEGDVSLVGTNEVAAVTGTIGSGGNFTMNNFGPSSTALFNLNLEDGGAFTFNQDGNVFVAGNLAAREQTIRATGDILFEPGLDPLFVTATGAVNLEAGGSVVIRGGGTFGNNDSANILADRVNISTGGDVQLAGGTTRGSHALVLGRNGVDMTVGGALRLNEGTAPLTFARIQTLSRSDPVRLRFPNLPSGGYFVNDVEGRVARGLTGIFTGAIPARAGETLLLEYGQP